MEEKPHTNNVPRDVHQQRADSAVTLPDDEHAPGLFVTNDEKESDSGSHSDDSAANTHPRKKRKLTHQRSQPIPAPEQSLSRADQPTGSRRRTPPWNARPTIPRELFPELPDGHDSVQGFQHIDDAGLTQTAFNRMFHSDEDSDVIMEDVDSVSVTVFGDL